MFEQQYMEVYPFYLCTLFGDPMRVKGGLFKLLCDICKVSVEVCRLVMRALPGIYIDIR